jgi:hypothetical protein
MDVAAVRIKDDLAKHAKLAKQRGIDSRNTLGRAAPLLI